MSKITVYSLEQIKGALTNRDEIIEAIEKCFISYTDGNGVTPPAGFLPCGAGDAMIKYGMINGDSTFTLKVATSFSGNEAKGLPNSSGIFVVFNAETGFAEAVLADEGYLTSVRTAAAGAAAAKYLAPKNVSAIGIIGTGNQARRQLSWLSAVTDCKEVFVYGRTHEKAIAYCQDMTYEGFSMHVAEDIKEITEKCNLIVTTTKSTEPWLFAEDIRPGTHITCMGADEPGKNEVDASVFGKADLIVNDSIKQCTHEGDTVYAVNAGLVKVEDIVELGEMFAGKKPGRTGEDQITIADLTGVAVQDVAIAGIVLKALRG